MTMEDRLTTLGSAWAVWAEHGRTMTDAQWSRPTRLETWDVRSLYAHGGSWPFMFTALVARVVETEPTHSSAADLLRTFNGPDGVAHRNRDKVAAGARADAATFGTADMVRQFAEAGPAAIATARALGPVTVDYFGMAILHLDEAVSIGIMEATVHLLDLQRALDTPPAVPAEALTHTARLLADMAPPVDLIEAATGRGPTSLFPVLS
jgi:uncharacterized protein (TIGR03083 family)